MSANLELRRQVWEALGWTIRQDRRSKYPWQTTSPSGDSIFGFRSCEDAASTLDPIDSDDGIAIRELQKLCKVASVLYRLHSLRDGGHECWFVDAQSGNQLIRPCFGPTVAIAICKAILAWKGKA